MRRVEAKIAESAAVSAILADIFTDQEPGGSADATAHVSSASTSLPTLMPGIDLRHNALVIEVLTRDSWSRTAWDELCARHELLADGAMETINEAAYDAHGASLLEGEDPVEINPDVVKELTR
jgi:hypothetical protein